MTNSAAADGVGARRSATKSQMREVGLVPNGGDHRNLRRRNRARQSFVVERKQVFERTAAPRHDDHVHITRAG